MAPQWQTWPANVSWIVSILGAGLMAYAFHWSDVHRPANWNPGGLSGLRVATALVAAGALSALYFEFRPRPPSEPRLRSSAEWQARAEALRNQALRAHVFAGLGAVSTLVGVLLVAMVQRGAQGAEPRRTTYRMLGLEAAYPTWTMLFLLLALVGLLTWVAHAARATPLDRAHEAAQVAAHFRRRQAEGFPLDPEELRALLERLDEWLAKLPAEERAKFAREPEANAFLRALGRG